MYVRMYEQCLHCLVNLILKCFQVHVGLYSNGIITLCSFTVETEFSAGLNYEEKLLSPIFSAKFQSHFDSLYLSIC